MISLILDFYAKFIGYLTAALLKLKIAKTVIDDQILWKYEHKTVFGFKLVSVMFVYVAAEADYSPCEIKLPLLPWLKCREED